MASINKQRASMLIEIRRTWGLRREQRQEGALETSVALVRRLFH